MPVVVQDIFASLPVTERGKSIVFGGHPKGKSFLYTTGKVVIIRDLENPKKCDVYTEHLHKVSVAKYAHHGNYICSGDITGKLRIWDTLDEEHKLKNEYRPFAGEVRDLVWGPESKRIAVCGQGNEIHAAVIMADSGNTVGKILGVARRGNSIDYKPTRPYRIAAGDDEHNVSFYEGPPFKFAKDLRNHSRFVNVVRFSPNGQYFASGSSDGHVFLYDGKSGDNVGELGGKTAHDGGVYSLSWSPDSKELLTASGDKSVKIWNVETKEEVVKFIMGSEMTDQQYSCLWVGDTLLSLSLSGCVHYLDRNNPEKPLRTLCGHSRALSAIINLPSERPHHVTADITGKVLKWDTESGEAREFSGAGHTNKVIGLAFDPDSNQIVSAGWDDKIRYTCASTLDFSASTTLTLDSQPTAMCYAGNGYIVLNTPKGIVLVRDRKKVFEIEHPENFTPLCVSAHGNVVAVARKKGGVNLYNIQGDSLVAAGANIELSKQIQALSFSPDGSMLAAGSDDKIIRVFMVSDGYQCNKELIGHYMKPTLLSWSPNSQFLASSGMDASLRLWDIAKGRDEVVERAHSHSIIHAMAWQSDVTLLSAGDDCLTKQWEVTW